MEKVEDRKFVSVTREGRLHGLALWFDATFNPMVYDEDEAAKIQKVLQTTPTIPLMRFVILNTERCRIQKITLIWFFKGCSRNWSSRCPNPLETNCIASTWGRRSDPGGRRGMSIKQVFCALITRWLPGKLFSDLASFSWTRRVFLSIYD